MHIELLAAMGKASSEVFSLGGVLSGSSATFLCPECVEVQQNRGMLSGEPTLLKGMDELKDNGTTHQVNNRLSSFLCAASLCFPS